jgi:hypothetical protein
VTAGDVRAALALGDARRALFELRQLLDSADQTGSDALAEWLGLLEQAGGALAGAGFAATAGAARRAPDDAAALAALGRRLHVEALPGLAATLLGRAHRLAPRDEAILAALISALGADGQHARACAVLREAPLPGDGAGGPSLSRRGVLARHAVLAGDLDEPRRCLPELLRSDHPAHQDLARTIDGMLARADAITGVSALDRRDLRGWHFVITGGLLLHCSPHGRDAGMNGRYAFVHDSYADCREALARVAVVAGALGRPLERILALGDRAGGILARAAAAVLDRPRVTWADAPDAAGLVVAYDLDGVAPAERDALRSHRPGQLVFCQAAAWTEEPAFAADLVMRLHQFSRAPWDRHDGIDPATGEWREVLADDADDATLAARIAAAPRAPVSAAPDAAPAAAIDAGGDAASDAAADLVALTDAARSITGDAAAGALRDAGPRRRAWCGSPVPSLRFA